MHVPSVAFARICLGFSPGDKVCIERSTQQLHASFSSQCMTTIILPNRSAISSIRSKFHTNFFARNFEHCALCQKVWPLCSTRLAVFLGALWRSRVLLLCPLRVERLDRFYGCLGIRARL